MVGINSTETFQWKCMPVLEHIHEVLPGHAVALLAHVGGTARRGEEDYIL